MNIEVEPYICFEVSGQSCAFKAESVSEILPLPQLSQPPGMSSSILGLLDLGENSIPIIKLDQLLGLPETKVGLYFHVIMMREMAGSENITVGFLVDRVSHFMSVEKTAVKKVQENGFINRCVVAEISTPGARAFVLSPSLLLSQRKILEAPVLTRGA